MSNINLSKYLIKDLEKVIFEKSKKDNRLKERDGFRPEIKSLSEEEWRYFLHAMRECYISGAERVCTELNKRADAEVRRAQKRAEDRIYSELAELMDL
jgi:hypothetical protein